MKTQILKIVALIVLTVTLSTLKANAMERKTVEKTTVLKCTINTSLATLANDIGEWPNQLMAKAEELGLEITGPQIWQYKGSDGNPATKFSLDICVPVKEAKGDAGKFQFETLPEFNCISEIHKGPLMKLGETIRMQFSNEDLNGFANWLLCQSRAFN